jgi:hypothetical protein
MFFMSKLKIDQSILKT